MDRVWEIVDRNLYTNDTSLSGFAEKMGRRAIVCNNVPENEQIVPHCSHVMPHLRATCF